MKKHSKNCETSSNNDNNEKKYINVDGNTACSNIAYFLSEIAEIYPITPSSAMAENCDEWSANGRKNIFGETLLVREMQSEAGASGALHGSLSAGVLSTTFTASQGLLLMLPNMFKISGELLPTVFHISARALSTHALSIFGDHSDIMAVRASGFNILASSNVQEAQDLALVSHIASLNTSLPFLHFFDGFRTSHEVQKIETISENNIRKFFPFDKVEEFKKRALDPINPVQKGTAQNPDIFFQNREASNKYYEKVYAEVENAMQSVEKITGRHYAPFEYYGEKNAEYVIVLMGSGVETATETIDYLNKNGYKVGAVNVRLFRPFNTLEFVKKLPKSVKKIAVLDRCKESNAIGEPLFLYVLASVQLAKINVEVFGGRYGLGSKEFTPNCVKAVFDNLKTEQPIQSFTVGIDDDITYKSLNLENFELKNDIFEMKFYGLGSDGTVSANKNSIKIIGEKTNKFTQGFFEYDSKKSGSITISHLRVSDKKIRAPYAITRPDFIAIHNYSFVARYDLIENIADNGTILINSVLNQSELSKDLPAHFVKTLKEKNVKFYAINASKIASELGLGNKINIIMQSAFFKLTNIVDEKTAREALIYAIKKSYGKKGDEVVSKNILAIDKGETELWQVDVSKLQGRKHAESKSTKSKYYNDFIKPINTLAGNKLPVSAFSADGSVPTDTTKFEKRGIGEFCPNWNSEKCIQCGMCALACPHSAIRAHLLDEKSLKNSPEDFAKKSAFGTKNLQYHLQVSPLDCTGCGVCAKVCPAHALDMTLTSNVLEKERKNLDFCETLPKISNPFTQNTPKYLQFEESYFKYSYACAGCGETPYIKLATTLFGKNMVIANATGCSSIYGGSAPACPYAKDENGCGPAWASSLFEDNAEFGYGIKLGINIQKNKLKNLINQLINLQKNNENILINNDNNLLNNINKNELKNKKINNFELINNKLINKLKKYIKNAENTENKEIESIFELLKTELNNNLLNKLNNKKLINNLNNNINLINKLIEEKNNIIEKIIKLKNYFYKKSMWIIGGDGWAYDIGFSGLDHILASGENVNILVLDTEVYSNTGGQSSKSTPSGAYAKFASDGKKTAKKDLGAIAMTYPNVYVASVSLGANFVQCINAFKEAEEHNGPSIIIAYSPCINHGLNMSNSNLEMKKAVESGYWFLYRHNPNKNPSFSLDSPPPSKNYMDFLSGETRFSALLKTNPTLAKSLFEKSENDAKQRYNTLKDKE